MKRLCIVTAIIGSQRMAFPEAGPLSLGLVGGAMQSVSNCSVVLSVSGTETPLFSLLLKSGGCHTTAGRGYSKAAKCDATVEQDKTRVSQFCVEVLPFLNLFLPGTMDLKAEIERAIASRTKKA